jgi:hypothetical protein
MTFLSNCSPTLGKLTDDNSESGLCVILYVAKLVQECHKKVLTKSDIENLIHDMIIQNQDRSLVNELRKEITRLVLTLSQKYSAECFNDSLAVYPSLFNSINDDSSDSSITSGQLTSSTFDTAYSDWQLSRKRRRCTKSAQPVSDTVSQSSSENQDADNYTSDSASQSSNNQVRYNRKAKASLNEDNGMETDEEDANDNESSNQQFRG